MMIEVSTTSSTRNCCLKDMYNYNTAYIVNDKKPTATKTAK